MTCPVTLLVAGTGSADDEDRRERLLAIDDVQRARAEAGVAAARIRLFPDAGHDLMRYRPAEVADEVARLADLPLAD